MTKLGASRRFAEHYFNFISNAVPVSAATQANADFFSKKDIPEPAQQLQYLAGVDQTKGHQAHIQALAELQLKSLQQTFPILVCGRFNALLYGYGSKQQLLQRFLDDSPFVHESVNVIQVSGFDDVALGLGPMSLMGQILSHILLCLDEAEFDSASNSVSKAASLEKVARCVELLNSPQQQLTLLVLHQLDSPAFRHPFIFECLHRLFTGTNSLRIMATIDNPHVANLMTGTQFDDMNWVWMDTTTMQPYGDELNRFLSDACAAASTRQTPRAAIIVLQSLTSNSRSIFKLMATHQLSLPEKEIAAMLEASDLSADAEKTEADMDEDASSGNASSGSAAALAGSLGLPYHVLFQRCQENFVVTVEANFRTQLTEFTDHDLFKSFEGTDGTLRFFIPFAHADLRQILQNI